MNKLSIFHKIHRSPLPILHCQFSRTSSSVACHVVLSMCVPIRSCKKWQEQGLVLVSVCPLLLVFHYGKYLYAPMLSMLGVDVL